MSEHETDPFGAIEPSPTASTPHADAGNASTGLGLESTTGGEQKTTALSVWQEKRSQILAERKQKAEEQKAQLLSTAKDDIKTFYATREQKLTATKKQNRSDEATSKKEYEALMQFGTRWEKVNRLINVTPKPQEKGAGARLDRMRKLLIQLKNQKDDDEQKKA